MKANKKIIFWGTPEFSLPSLQALFALGLVSAVVTQADKPAGRQLGLQSSPVKKWAEANDLPVLSPLKLDQDFISDIKKYLPATFVIVAYGKIIKAEVLALSELMPINIHPSLLPKLRGASPIQSALLAGIAETGVSLMQVDEQMDHGPILAQTKVKIDASDDYLTLSNKLAKVGAEILASNIQDYLAGQLVSKSQDDAQATFCKLLNKADGKIDWQKSGLEILNQIKAFQVWPSSYTEFKNLTVKIVAASLSDEKLSPGQINFSKQKLLFGTSSQAVQIDKIQPANKKVMSAEEFIRGYSQYLT